MITQDPIDRRWLVLAFAMIGVAGLVFGSYGLYENLYPPEPYPMTLERSSGGSASSEELHRCLSLSPNQICHISESEDE